MADRIAAPSKRHRPSVPLDKRKRTSLACTQCRRWKKKCQRVIGSRCNNCDKADLACTFDPVTNASTHEPVGIGKNTTQASKRFSQPTTLPEGLVREFNGIYPGIALRPHHLITLSQLLNRYQITQVPGIDSTRRHDEQNVETAWLSEMPSSPQGSASILRHPEISASVNEKNMQAFEKVYSIVADTISGIEDSVVWGNIDQERNPVTKLPLYSEDDTALLAEILDQFPSVIEADFLVDTFFSYCMVTFFYIEEKGFRTMLANVQSFPDRETLPDTASICLALMVFAGGCSFAHFQRRPRPASLNDHIEVDDSPGIRFFGLAQKLIPRVLTQNSLESLQACLLMAMYVEPLDFRDLCYSISGLAIRIAINLSLHQEKRSTGSTSMNVEIRRRIFWTIYSLDRNFTTSLGYPETLQERDINVPLPSRRVDLDDEGSTRIDRLLCLIELSRLQTQILRDGLYSNGCTTIADVQLMLDSWKRRLTDRSRDQEANEFRGTIHLLIMTQMIWIYVGQKTLIESIAALLQTRQSQSQQRCAHSQQQPELPLTCVSAAKEVIHCIEMLVERDLLGRFSYNDIHVCSSATVVLLLGSLIHPEESLVSSIDAGMKALTVMSQWTATAKKAINVLTALHTATRELSSQLNSSHALRPKAQGLAFCESGPTLEQSDLEYGQISKATSKMDVQQLEGSISTDHSTAQFKGDDIVEDHFGFSPSDFAVIDSEFFSSLEAMTTDLTAQDLHLFGCDGLRILGELSWDQVEILE